MIEEFEVFNEFRDNILIMCTTIATMRSSVLLSVTSVVSSFITHSVKISDVIYAFSLNLDSTGRCLKFLEQRGLADFPNANRGSFSVLSTVKLKMRTVCPETFYGMSSAFVHSQ